MNFFTLVTKNISKNTFRNGIIFFCAMLVAGGVFSATLLIQGAIRSLEDSLSRLGADVLIVPWGAVTQRADVQEVRLVGTHTLNWMPEDFTTKIAAVPGISQVSAQLYLTTLHKSPFSVPGDLHLVAFDPVTDFTLRPWLQTGALPDLPPGAAIVGSDIRLSADQRLSVMGYSFQIVAHLAPTGTDADQTLFMSFKTALDFSQRSQFMALTARRLQPEQVSAILVRVAPEQEPAQVYMNLIESVGRIKPLKSTDMLQSQRQKIIGLARSETLILTALWLVATLFIGLIFTIAVHERRQEIGVLRALGARRAFIIFSLWVEGLVLAFSGGLFGLVLVGSALGLFESLHVQLGNFPVISLAAPGLVGVALWGLLLAVASVSSGTLLPAFRISYQETSLSMRE